MRRSEAEQKSAEELAELRRISKVFLWKWQYCCACNESIRFEKVWRYKRNYSPWWRGIFSRDGEEMMAYIWHACSTCAETAEKAKAIQFDTQRKDKPWDEHDNCATHANPEKVCADDLIDRAGAVAAMKAKR